MNKTINLCGVDVPCTKADLLSEFYHFDNEQIDIIIYVQGIFPEHAPAKNPFASQAKIDFYDASVRFKGDTVRDVFQMRHHNFDAIRFAYTKVISHTKTQIENTQACLSQFRV